MRVGGIQWGLYRWDLPKGRRSSWHVFETHSDGGRAKMLCGIFAPSHYWDDHTKPYWAGTLSTLTTRNHFVRKGYLDSRRSASEILPAPVCRVCRHLANELVEAA